MNKFIALIPARYASTRFEGKPLIDIFGKSMIQRVYEKAATCFQYVAVATDDIRIEETVKNFGGVAIMTSSQHRSGTDRCYEALQKAEIIFNTDFDVAINVQGDEPFIDISQLELLKRSFEDINCDIATLVKPFTSDEDIFNPNSPKVVLNNRGYAIYFSRSPIPYLRGSEKESWQTSHTYYKHLGVYGYRTEVLKTITSLPQGRLELCESLEQLRWIENGYNIKCETTDIQTDAIDTPADLAAVLKKYKKLFEDE